MNQRDEVGMTYTFRQLASPHTISGRRCTPMEPNHIILELLLSAFRQDRRTRTSVSLSGGWDVGIAEPLSLASHVSNAFAILGANMGSVLSAAPRVKDPVER